MIIESIREVLLKCVHIFIYGRTLGLGFHPRCHRNSTTDSHETNIAFVLLKIISTVRHEKIIYDPDRNSICD
jgi:hypothetical protein